MSTNQSIGIKFLSIEATDIHQAVDFYHHTLGFELRQDNTHPASGERWVELGPAGRQVRIAFLKVEQPTHRTLGALSTQHLDDDYSRLKAAGVQFEGEVMRTEYYAGVRLQDPFGNRWFFVRG